MAELLTPTIFLSLIIACALALLISLRLAKDPIVGVVLIAFFLPFERLPNLDIAGFSLKINHLIGILTFLFLALAIVFNRHKIAPNPLAIPLAGLFFSFLITGSHALNFFRHVTVYISLLLMVVIFLVVINSLQDRDALRRVVVALLIGGGFMSLIALYQFFGDMAGFPPALTGLDPGYTSDVFGFPRIHGFTKEPLYYANYLFIPLGVGIALLFSNKLNVAKERLSESSFTESLIGPRVLPVILLMFITFILTLSRGAFLAAVPFTLIFVVLYTKQILNWRNIILGGLTLAIALYAVYSILNAVSPRALDRFISHAKLEDVLVTRTGESGFGRLGTFQQAISAWKESPVSGIGLGNFGPYVKHYPVVKPESGWPIVNNEYLELLAESGWVGLLIVMLTLLILFVRSIIAYRATNDSLLKAIMLGLLAAFVAITTQYNFFSTFYIIHIWFLFGLMVATQNVILSGSSQTKKSSE